MYRVTAMLYLGSRASIPRAFLFVSFTAGPARGVHARARDGGRETQRARAHADQERFFSSFHGVRVRPVARQLGALLSSHALALNAPARGPAEDEAARLASCTYDACHTRVMHVVSYVYGYMHELNARVGDPVEDEVVRLALGALARRLVRRLVVPDDVALAVECDEAREDSRDARGGEGVESATHQDEEHQERGW